MKIAIGLFMLVLVVSSTIVLASFLPAIQAQAGQPKQWRQLLTYSGSATSITPPFTIDTPPWRVSWTFTPSANGIGYFGFQVVPGPVGFGGGSASQETSDSVEFSETGMFYLEIMTSSGVSKWTVTVEEFG